MFHLLNEITGILAIFMLGNAARGFWPPMWRKLRHVWSIYSPEKMGVWQGFLWKLGQFTASDMFFVALIVLDAKTMLRIFYWDVVNSLNGNIYQSTAGTLMSSAFNITSFVGGMVLCYALYLTIPPESRKGWSILTAPGYPVGLRVWPFNAWNRMKR